MRLAHNLNSLLALITISANQKLFTLSPDVGNKPIKKQRRRKFIAPSTSRLVANMPKPKANGTSYHLYIKFLSQKK
jgi:hypothetical protein